MVKAKYSESYRRANGHGLSFLWNSNDWVGEPSTSDGLSAALMLGFVTDRAFRAQGESCSVEFQRYANKAYNDNYLRK